ncbi:hypothetical protein CHS0354_013933 [Potamilus streckersoni]|uniref:Uncharacterized protein n=1 Tax=Potamilus streckersoni TaxID=2493646 RepID=A0AAE0RWR3_9BIVA|nr:hypothetical protein CHS0354_013933 [Potamilus streckersoni]
MEFWKPNNLLTCLNLILKTLSLWVECGVCPNYFITNENMFLGKVHGPFRKQLHGFLVHLIDQDFKYLTQIGCDGLGQALSEACSKQQTQPDALHTVIEALQRKHDSDDHCRRSTALYLPSAMRCCRSVGADPDLRDPKEKYWYDWAVVDARPYMYFLQHLVYSALGMEKHRMAALDNLFWSITQKRIMHPETCLNVLAYCLKQEGQLNLALRYLLLSLQLKPEHNAAVWQIFDMLNQRYHN